MTQPVRVFIQVFILWLAGLGAATQFAKIAVPFVDIGLLYPEYAGSIGWLLSIISLIGAVFGAVSGAVTGRVGPVRLLIFGLLLGGAISLFQSTIPGFYAMLASRVLEGLSHLAIVVAAPTLIAQITQGKARNAAMVLWSSFFGVAFALNAWIGLPFIDQFGLSAFFGLHGGLMLATAGLIVLIRLQVDMGQPEKAHWSLKYIAEVHLQTYRSAFVAAPALGWFFYTLTFVSLLAILPGQLPEATRASIAGLMPLAGIVLSWLVVPLLLNFVSSVVVINLGFGLGILTISALFWGASLPVVCIALFAVLGLVQGGSFAAVPQLNASAEAQALGYGAMAQMGNGGNLLGTPLLLAILLRSDEAAMLAVVICIYATAIAFHLWFASRRRQAEPV
ncbi:MFS transporter [Ruegeria sp. Ofav3-42]|uniref:MFS transporter n=1 Tax=Ruegeria sp. Ofav3-42 TaxID=2917759 RepID=UPI001EF67689|nr:MFS transporter [Ruegeria sp. Ofav3-42]MCG7518114.1 MFS transporter [Ruegeria sp. Ofav3-42]